MITYLNDYIKNNIKIVKYIIIIINLIILNLNNYRVKNFKTFIIFTNISLFILLKY